MVLDVFRLYNELSLLRVLRDPTVMQPVKMPSRPYPMSRIVGQDMVKLALLLAAGEKTNISHRVC